MKSPAVYSRAYAWSENYDLEDLWKLQEEDNEEEQYIFMKLILPYESQKECAEYLTAQKITHSYIFAK